MGRRLNSSQCEGTNLQDSEGEFDGDEDRCFASCCVR